MTRLQRRVLLLVGVSFAAIFGGTILVSREEPGDARTEPGAWVGAPQERIKVQVLNAGGVDGLARAATGHLRDAGFDVVEYGDAASWDRDSTWVLDRMGRPAAAYAVADALGIGNVRSDPDPDLFVDVTVLLGREWTPDRSTGGGVESSTELPWWDPRSWVDR